MDFFRNQCANALRFLAIDAVEKANSGHPGMPMGMASIAEVLWRDFLKHNPQNSHWPNRDRFILSNGHGSMLLYALLHLTGYPISIEDIKNFRQLHSLTPGHPEYGRTTGVETTTGPLGQGLANAIGMALSEKISAAQFNEPHFPLVDHHTYVFVGDGCLMEGISHEACSLAGLWKLGKLIVFWDDNGISIDGKIQEWFGQNIPKRFESYGWQVIESIDGHCPKAIRNAILAAQGDSERPSLLCCRTKIGYGSPNKEGTEQLHGSPLGSKEAQLTREHLEWTYAPFEIPEDIYEAFDARQKGATLEKNWTNLWNQYQKNYPEKATEWIRRQKKELPANFHSVITELTEEMERLGKNQATRKSSQDCLNRLGTVLPELVGGSADLTASNLTRWTGAQPVTQTSGGQYIFYGVREFAMAAIQNGIALYGGFIPFSGTFLTFSDYGKNAYRMAALMQIQSIFLFSHDSIGVGEDGPTHQPIEQLGTLRMIPRMTTWRPCDGVETVVAWKQILLHKTGPSCLFLTRQNVPFQARSAEQITLIEKGGYILRDVPDPQIIVIATGSEVSIAMEAAKIVNEKSSKVRVVSMPSPELFLQQDQDYQTHVLPPTLEKRIAIEAGHPCCWYRFVGTHGAVLGIESFGESGPAEKVYEFLQISSKKLIQMMESLL